MSVQRVSRTLLATSCVAAPLAGLIAATAYPAQSGSRDAELLAISHHPGKFYVYAIFMLLSSYLLVPAVLAVIATIKDRRPGLALVGGGLAMAGMLVAVGDAAVELMYWQMGQPSADHKQMTALANRYESAAGSSLVYAIGGLAALVGLVLLGIGLWRAHELPRWVGIALPLGFVANVVGFSGGSSALLIGSYLVLTAAFVPVAIALPRAEATDDRTRADAGLPLVAGRTAS